MESLNLSQDLFPDEEDDYPWNNQASLSLSNIQTDFDKDATLFFLSQSTASSSSLSSISLSSTLTDSLTDSYRLLQTQSANSHSREDLFDAFKTTSKGSAAEMSLNYLIENDSGYESTSKHNSQQINDFVPYNHNTNFDVKEYEKKLKSFDLNVEVENFLRNPETNEVFRPNLDYYETKLIEAKVIPDLKDFIRQNLQKELNKLMQNKVSVPVLDRVENIEKCSQSLVQNPEEELQNAKRCISPDIFECEPNELDEPDDTQNILSSSKPADLSPSVLEEANEELFLLSQCVASQIPLEEELTQRSTSRRISKLLEDIQKITDGFLEKIVNDEPIELSIRNSNISENCFLDSDEVLTLRPTSECTVKKISMTNEKSRFRFEIIMFLLSEIHHFLLTGTSCTARELYYKDPEFVKDPVHIHLGMKDVCNLLNATPWELGVFSSSKGLIAGSLIMSLASGEDVNCALHSGGILLPHDTTGVKSLQSTAKYVLLVEKDTVYEKLLKQNIFEILGPDVILITGKGFPDINTRVIVKKISVELKIPIYGLFDADPYGIEIFFVYRHGSRAMSFNADHLACPHVKWIGVHPSEIDLLGIPSIALSTRDRKRLKNLLDRPYVSDLVKSELVVMQQANRKAEIEGMSSFSENYLLAEYIPNKIKRNFVM